MDFSIWWLILNKCFIAAIGAQVTSQAFKVIRPVFSGKLPDISKIADYGGMPSAHTAFITGVAAAIGFSEGWTSPMTALALVVAAILIYDIIKMRMAVDINLSMTKRLMEKNGLEITEKIPQFKAHTLPEIIVGGIWGVICAGIVCFLWH